MKRKSEAVAGAYANNNLTADPVRSEVQLLTGSVGSRTTRDERII
jgi:hypothetical protein